MGGDKGKTKKRLALWIRMKGGEKIGRRNIRKIKINKNTRGEQNKKDKKGRKNKDKRLKDFLDEKSKKKIHIQFYFYFIEVNVDNN